MISPIIRKSPNAGDHATEGSQHLGGIFAAKTSSEAWATTTSSG